MRTIPKQRVAVPTPVPAPVGGLDDTTSLADMGSQYAIEMLNLYPSASALRVRDGYREHVTGMASAGKTLMSYNKPDGTFKMFCCTDSGIYDVSISTATPTLVKAITEGKVVWTQFSNLAGNWLIGCNGVDPAFIYDGTTWVDFVNSGTPTNPGEINGALSPSGINFVHQHKNRLWFLESGTMTAWYLPLNAVAGTVTAFPMGGIFTRGGYLNAIFSWTMDGGYSVDDIFVLQTSQGEIAGYGGTDPNSVDTWFLAARYRIGTPLGNRGNVDLNGDFLMLTVYGLVPLSKVVGGQYRLGATDAAEATASGRISRTLNTIVKNRSGAPEWEITNCPSAQSIFLSVPESSGYPPMQLVMNSLTGAWTVYDLPAVTIHEHGGVVYFTDADGNVQRHSDVTVDAVMLDGSGGTAILSGFQQAYNYFNQPSVNKHYKMVKPIFESTSQPSYLLTVPTDFTPGGLALLGTPGVSVGVASQWDVALWDEQVWSPPLTSWQEWVGVVGVGYSASLVVKIRSTVETRYVATHWMHERGYSL